MLDVPSHCYQYAANADLIGWPTGERYLDHGLMLQEYYGGMIWLKTLDRCMNEKVLEAEVLIAACLKPSKSEVSAFQTQSTYLSSKGVKRNDPK